MHEDACFRFVRNANDGCVRLTLLESNKVEPTPGLMEAGFSSYLSTYVESLPGEDSTRSVFLRRSLPSNLRSSTISSGDTVMEEALASLLQVRNSRWTDALSLRIQVPGPHPPPCLRYKLTLVVWLHWHRAQGHQMVWSVSWHVRLARWGRHRHVDRSLDHTGPWSCKLLSCHGVVDQQMYVCSIVCGYVVDCCSHYPCNHWVCDERRCPMSWTLRIVISPLTGVGLRRRGEWFNPS